MERKPVARVLISLDYLQQGKEKHERRINFINKRGRAWLVIPADLKNMHVCLPGVGEASFQSKTYIWIIVLHKMSLEAILF